MSACSSLPAGWASASLAQLGGIVGGKTPSKAVPAFWHPGEIPWVSPKDMKRFVLDGSEDLISQMALTMGGMNVLPQGSVLMVTRSGILAHTFPVALAAVPLSINQDIKAVPPIPGVNPRYLAYQLKSLGPAVLKGCAKDGTTVASVDSDLLSAFSIAVAPEAEQRRIADKLDTVLARVDSVNDRLARVAPLLKRFRQSVLAAATSGKLTEEWRDATEIDWSFVRADVICSKVQSGGTPKAGFVDAGVPFLKVYNIVGQKVAFDYKPQFVARDVHGGELKKSQALPGDVLMNIVGPPLGKVAVVPTDHPEWNINQAITLFRPSDRVSSGWLYIVLCEGAPIRAVLASTKGSVGQVNISLSQCRAFEIPVPPPEEQAEITRRVDLLFAYADRLEARLQAAQIAAERLTPALLAKAFRGELVPQDPNDEPASELLKRLAAQRAQAGAAPGRARGRQPAATARQPKDPPRP